MRRHDPINVDAALTRLADQVDQLDRTVTGWVTDTLRLREDVDAHSRSLVDLAEIVRRPPSAATAARGDADADLVPDWLTVRDPELAVDWLQALTGWSTTVWCQYRPLPGCWPWHPPVVAELLVCNHIWTAATYQGVPAEGLATWHDRWRPGVARRIDPLLAACDRAHGRHVTTGGQQWIYDPTVVDEYAEWWATTHGVGSTPAPGLTRDASP